MSDSEPECPSQFNINWSPLKEIEALQYDKTLEETNDQETVMVLDLLLPKPQDNESEEHYIIDLPIQLPPLLQKSQTNISNPKETSAQISPLNSTAIYQTETSQLPPSSRNSKL